MPRSPVIALFAFSSVVAAVLVDINHRPVRANIQVHRANFTPWPTPAQTAPMLSSRGSRPFLSGAPLEPLSRLFFLPSTAKSQLIAYSVGDTVDVLWHGKWYPAIVRAVTEPGQWLITYIGHSNSWDEVVGSDRIRWPQAQPQRPSSPGSNGLGNNPSSAPHCGFGSTCGAVPLNASPTGLFGTGTW
jgi:hypothetical protein